jgi:hypothetical protein
MARKRAIEALAYSYTTWEGGIHDAKESPA